MFSLLENSDDFFEVQIIKRIKEDYDKFHKHDFIMFENMVEKDDIYCPRCKTHNYISHGKDKNGIRRFKCESVKIK